MSDLRIAQAAQDILDAAETALTGETYTQGVAGVADTLLPERVTVQPAGGWAWDECEQLAVHLEAFQWAQHAGGAVTMTAPSPAVPAPALPHATFVVTLVMDHPSGEKGNPPPAAQVTAASKRLYAAAATVLRALVRDGADGTLLTDGACELVTVSPAEDVEPPQGGFAGLRIRVTVTLPNQTEGT